MSYILEALKKAQAERQLGTLPTIHAPQLQGRDDAAGARLKKPLWLATGLTALVVMTLLLWWRQPLQGAVPAAPIQTPAVAPIPVAPLFVTPLPVVLPSLVALPATSPPATPLPVVLPSLVALPAMPPLAMLAPTIPIPATQPPVTAIKPAAVVAPDAQPLKAPRIAATLALPARAAASISQAASPSMLPAARMVVEDPVLSLRELPEPVQRQIEPLAIGGYIYSKNPADRLLLVGKVLHHEGEEVGPGLTLEKLQPKSAVFNFKGYRYRVPY